MRREHILQNWATALFYNVFSYPNSIWIVVPTWKPARADVDSSLNIVIYVIYLFIYYR